MKILMVAPQPFYTERGTPINIRLMCQVLGSAGNTIDLITFPTGKDVALPNVNLIRLPNFLKVKTIPIGPSIIKITFDVILFFYTFILLIKNRYDVIHGIEEGGFIAVLFGVFKKVSSIYDMDSCIVDQLRYSRFIKSPTILKFAGIIEAKALQNASLIITVCQALTEKASTLTSQPIVQIEDVPLQGLNQVKNKHIDQFLTEFGLKDKKRVIYTGNLEAYQGIDLLLDTWVYLAKHHKIHETAILVIVGGDEQQLIRYSQLTAQKKLTNSIKWVGQRPSQEMSIWMAMADVLVSPRLKGENTPLKLYSYMAASRPIVATDIKSHSQVLDDSLAYLAKPDPVSLGEAILQPLKDPNLSKLKSQNAKAIMKLKYDYPVFKTKLLSAYKILQP